MPGASEAANNRRTSVATVVVSPSREPPESTTRWSSVAIGSPCSRAHPTGGRRLACNLWPTPPLARPDSNSPTPPCGSGPPSSWMPLPTASCWTGPRSTPVAVASRPDRGVLLWSGGQSRVVGVRRGDDLLLQLAEGDPVPPVGTSVRGAVADERRTALMRTHSALHLLSGVVYRDFGALVTGGNMEPLSARMDFDLPDVPADFKSRIAEACAREVAADRRHRVALGQLQQQVVSSPYADDSALPAGPEQHTLVGRLAPATGVERGPVQHDAVGRSIQDDGAPLPQGGVGEFESGRAR